MVEVMMVLTVLNTAVAVAALVLVVIGLGRQSGTDPAGPEHDEEEHPFRLNDKKMQEGIANLLGFQPGGDEE